MREVWTTGSTVFHPQQHSRHAIVHLYYSVDTIERKFYIWHRYCQSITQTEPHLFSYLPPTPAQGARCVVARSPRPVIAEAHMRSRHPVPVPIDAATFQLPLIATPRATGFPQATTDYEEVGIDFNCLIYRQPAATHVMEVAEDSLHGSGLWAKDLVIIDCSLTPQAGDLVVAQMDDSFVLARFERQNGAVLLTPENPAYQPMVVTPEQEPVCLFGVVTYVLHRVKRRRK